MASVKKCFGGFRALLFLLVAVPILRADDAVLFDDPLFDDGEPMVVADPQEGNVPAAPPAEASQGEPANPGESAPNQPANPPEIVRPEASFNVDLQPREIPEVIPGQPAPAAEPPAAEPPAASTPELPETPTSGPAASQPAPAAEPEPAAEENPEPPAGEEIALVKTLVSPPDSVLEQLGGRPTSLADVLEGVSAPEQRRSLTEGYWETAQALALYHLSLISAGDIEDCITRFTQRGTPSESQTAVLVSARRLAAHRSAEAKIGLVRAQCRLAELRRQNGAGDQTIRLAIPTDSPNTLPYRTRIDQISREKRLAPQAAYYAEAIPAYYEMTTLYDKAAADALEAYRALYFAEGTSADLLLSAADRLNDAKERLIRSVCEYNKLIAAYVAETVGPGVRGERLISTMIPSADRSSIPAWDAAAPTRVASVSPIPTQYSPRRPRPVSAEIPPFDSFAAPNSENAIRPDQNAEMLR